MGSSSNTPERPLEKDAKKALAEVHLEEEEQDSQESEETKTKDLGQIKSDTDHKAELAQKNKEEFSNIGWREIKFENLPSEGKFYPENIKFEIRPARAEEIKHYSSLSENDIMDIDSHINDIVVACTRILDTNSGQLLKSELLKEADKYYFLFSIRDLSMKNLQKKHKLMQTAKCAKCGQTCTTEITNQTFGNYKINTGISKWYDPDQRCFVVKSEAFSAPMKFYIPSIGVMQSIKTFIATKEREKRAGKDSYYDRDLMLNAQFLIKDAKDVNDQHMEKLHKKVKRLNIDETTVLNHVVQNISIGADPHLIFTCKDAPKFEGGCSDDYSFTSAIRFQGGFRSLFDFSDIISGLFGDTE